jgi:hypothetical protein
MDYFNNVKRTVTFKDLYNYCIKIIDNVGYEEEIKEFLKESKYKFEPQEALFRFLTWFKCIENLEEAVILDGNYNNKKLTEYKSEKFFKESLKAGGDSSDMTLKKGGMYIVFTSKNYKDKTNPNDLDIEKIKNQKLYKEDKTLIGIVVRDKKNITNTNTTSNAVKGDFEKVKKNKLLYDQEDIIKGIQKFKDKYKKGEINIDEGNKVEYKMRPHQEWTVRRTKKLIEEGEKKIIWGHVARSGKSYMMLFMMKEMMREKKVKILLVTTVPNETINQYKSMIDGTDIELRVELSKEYKNEKNNEHENILMISSSQLLNNKVNTEEKMEYVRMDYDIVFVDEAHYGGSTDKIIEKMKDVVVNKKTVWVYVTATYTKPEMRLNVKKDNIITWNLVDIGLMKNKDKEKIVERKGEIFSNVIKNNERIDEEYKRYPEMEIIQLNIEKCLIEEIKEEVKENGYGWSIESLFNIRNEEFENYDALEKITEEIVGEGISRMGKGSIIKQLKNKKSKNVIMIYLPVKNKTKIDILQKKYKELMESNSSIKNEYKIITMNANENNKPEEISKEINNIENEKDIIVLCGDMCSIGITIENCDIVVLMNNTESYDNIYQKMFRCMTEREGKEKGYVIDINMKRSINIIVEMARTMTKSGNTKEALREMLETRMINFKRRDLEWKRDVKMEIEETVEYIMTEWRKNNVNNMERVVETQIRGITIDTKCIIELDKIMKISRNKKQSENICKNDLMEGIGDGEVRNEKVNNNEQEKKEELFDIEEFLKKLIPALGFMTMNENINYRLSIEKMIEKILIFLKEKTIMKEKVVENKDKVKELLSNIYINMDEEDKRKIDDILEEIRNMYKKESKNRKRLGELVDKYLVPTTEEKNKNAEVSTPVELRKEMIDKLKEYNPEIFRNKEIKIFEPCIGKGGFVVDLIDEMMEGLKEIIKDEELRYKHIVENCIYMSEINEWNVYIVENLINPMNKYKINMNVGDTLELDIKKKWNLEGFDVIIGNPPYNEGRDKANGNTLWPKFVRYGLNTLQKEGYLVYIHPPTWRKPCIEKTTSKIKGLFYEMCHKRTMKYIKIYTSNDGKKFFKCGTKFDYYILKNTEEENKTIIENVYGTKEELNLKEWTFLPNGEYSNIKKLLNNNYENKNFLNDRSSYATTKKNVKKEKDDTHKFTIISHINKTEVRYMYTDTNNKGLFRKPKIILGDSGIKSLKNIVIDADGIYGTSEHTMGIKITNYEEGEKIKNILQGKTFLKIMENCIWSNYQIDWMLFEMFKEDFWKELE